AAAVLESTGAETSTVGVKGGAVPPKPNERNIAMFKSTSTSLILLGVLAIIVGIIAIAWPARDRQSRRRT
ncbi:MAG TPA: hypothetical protein VIY52_12125, partial [Streptosporangiaceae bacterium]